jgi:hypothetical protein
MALKVSGTTVINDSRQLQNITNLKTVNGQSILGTGDIAVSVGDVSADNVTETQNRQFIHPLEKQLFASKLGESNLKTINGESIVGSGDLTISGGSGGFSPPFNIGTIGQQGILIGDFAAENLWGSSENLAFGERALHSFGYNQSVANIAIGVSSCDRGTQQISDASFNTAIGRGSLTLMSHNYPVPSAYDMGQPRLEYLTKTDSVSAQSPVNCSVAVGAHSLFGNRGHHGDVGIGFNSVFNSGGVNNTAVGTSAMSNFIGADNVSIGANSSRFTNGMNNVPSFAEHPPFFNNVALGRNAFSATSSFTGFSMENDMTQGFSNNVAIGPNALSQLNYSEGYVPQEDMTSNIAIGRNAMRGALVGARWNICIASAGLDDTLGLFSTQNPVFNIAGHSHRVVMGHTGVTNAYIQVPWTVVSDARDKTNFAAVPHGLEFVKRLKPTAFQFRQARESEETNGGVRYGFKAQDIAAIEPEGVIVDSTNPEKLYYNEGNMVAVLVKAIQELSAEVDRLKSKAS